MFVNFKNYETVFDLGWFRIKMITELSLHCNWCLPCELVILTFVHVHLKENILEPRKFSTSSFRWIYTIWKRLQRDLNIFGKISTRYSDCLWWQKFCGLSQELEFNESILLISLWYKWRDFGMHRSKRAAAFRFLPKTYVMDMSRHLLVRVTSGLMHNLLNGIH